MKKKTIVHFHAFSTESTIDSSYRKYYRYLFNSADIVIALSDLWKRNINRTFDLGDKVKVIYNPCTIEISPMKYSKENYILFAGALNERKGFIDLINAFAKICKEHQNWKLIFAGSGDIDIGRKLSVKLGIESQVEFLGWISGEQKDKVFKEASIFCLPSYAEGFPMAVLDAWAYGLPVISTPVGGIPDIAKNGVNILLFNPGDIETLSLLLSKIIQNSTLREKLSNASLILSQTQFNLQTINRQIESLYKSLSGDK